MRLSETHVHSNGKGEGGVKHGFVSHCGGTRDCIGKNIASNPKLPNLKCALCMLCMRCAQTAPCTVHGPQRLGKWNREKGNSEWEGMQAS